MAVVPILKIRTPKLGWGQEDSHKDSLLVKWKSWD